MATVKIRYRDIEAELVPGVCMCCGEPADVDIRRKFSWHPSWVGFLVFFGLLPYIFFALMLTKRFTLHVPMCDRHKNYWSMRMIAGAIGFIVPLALIILSVVAPPRLLPLLAMSGVIGLLIWLIALAIVSNRSIRPTEITDSSATLVNVSSEFRDQLKANRDAASADGRLSAVGKRVRTRPDRGELLPPPPAVEDDEDEDDDE